MTGLIMAVMTVRALNAARTMTIIRAAEIVRAAEFKPISQSVMSVPDIDTSFKAYMDYRTITNRRSAQWAMQQQAQTDANGLRTYGGRYMVAVGSYYGDVGDELTVMLDTGEELEVVIGDMKADSHTDGTHRYCPMSDGSGNVLEFIVDVYDLPDRARNMGDISYVDGFEGEIEGITGYRA